MRPASPRSAPPVRCGSGLQGLASWQALALLGFALVAPATLPAGGGSRRLPEVRRRQSDSEPLLSSTCLSLRCAPELQAPVLATVASGERLRVVHQWLSPRGRRWLRV
ncbi:MAG: hypothetical protein ACKOZW_05735, partial [Cyanobium sp.]